MFAVITCLRQHDPKMVLWAVVICLVAVGAGLVGYRRAISTQGVHRAAWITSGAVLLGSGVWATHFMAMLAYQHALRVSFGLDLTAISLVVAIGGMGLGIAMAVSDQTPWRRAIGGAICGGAVALMHFVGVAAMRLPATLVWDPVLVGVAIAIGIGGGACAFVSAGDLSRIGRWVAAGAFGVFAICGMHFTAMAAVTLVPSFIPFHAGSYGRTELSYAVGAFAGFIALASGALVALDRISEAATFAGVRAALNCAPSAMAMFDADGRLVIWNEAYAAIGGASGFQLKRGMSIRTILDAAEAAGLPQHVADEALGVRGTRERMTMSAFQTPDNRWFQPQLGPTSNGGFVVLLTDITSHLELARRESAARQAAEAANQAKSDFLANMSHEIRTPLNGVLGTAQVMAADELTPAQRERLEVITHSGGLLLSVLDGLLDLRRVESGQLELETHLFELRSLMNAATASFAPLAARRRLGFAVIVEPAAEGSWRGDAGKLSQILANLLSNALKFTDEGAITARVHATPGGLAFEVSDTGVGIAPGKQDMIFETFTQADASPTRRHGGAGLGLALSRRYAALMGGRLEVASVEGAGSTFTLTVPLDQVAPAKPESVATDHGARAPVRILAAEDNPTNQKILRALLAPLGVELTMVENGGEAVEAWRRGAFDLILMDIQMPQMNGIEATREIRLCERSGEIARTPIIAVTANVMRDQVEAYLAAGIDSVVAKPIDLSALISAIDRALSDDSDGPAAGHLEAA